MIEQVNDKIDDVILEALERAVDPDAQYYGDHIKAIEQLYRTRVDYEKVVVQRQEAENAKEARSREMDAKMIEALARKADADTKKAEVEVVRTAEAKAKLADVDAKKLSAKTDLAGKVACGVISAVASGALTVWCAGTILNQEQPGPIRSKAFGLVTKFIPKI
jgi:hypothetical protein